MAPNIPVFTATACRFLAAGLQRHLLDLRFRYLGNICGPGAGLPKGSANSDNAVGLIDHTFVETHLRSREQKRQWLQDTPVLAIGPYLTDPFKRAALRVGCHGCLATTEHLDHLPKAIAELANGGYWFEPHILFETAQHETMQPLPRRSLTTAQVCLDTLTGREKTIVHCISLGSRNKEIADKLGITEKTVKLHLSRIYRKLGMSSRLQLAVALNGQAGLAGKRLDAREVDARAVSADSGNTGLRAQRFAPRT